MKNAWKQDPPHPPLDNCTVPLSAEYRLGSGLRVVVIVEVSGTKLRSK
jgi:hypothetical protein